MNKMPCSVSDGPHENPEEDWDETPEETEMKERIIAERKKAFHDLVRDMFPPMK